LLEKTEIAHVLGNMSIIKKEGEVPEKESVEGRPWYFEHREV